MEVDIVVVRQRIAPLPQHTGFPDVSLMVTVIVFLLLLLLGALVNRVILVVCIAAGASLRLVVILAVHIAEGAFVHIAGGASLRLVVVFVVHIAAGAFVVHTVYLHLGCGHAQKAADRRQRDDKKDETDAEHSHGSGGIDKERKQARRRGLQRVESGSRGQS
jgi:hypothetical protein